MENPNRTSIKSTNLEFDHRLAEEMSKVKNVLIGEITQFKDGSSHAEQVFSKQHDNEFNEAFTVREPVLVSGTMRYTVTGVDSEGPFSVKRRFKEFFTMRRVMVERWPGCFVPSIPEKVLVNVDVTKMKVSMKGNSEAEFIEERRALLERFLREMSKFKFLVQSSEFRIFAQQAGEVDKALDALPKQTANQILEKYRATFTNVDEGVPHHTVVGFLEKCNTFQILMSKCAKNMDVYKKDLKKFVAAQELSCKNNTRLIEKFRAFEDLSLDYFSDGDMDRRTFTHSRMADFAQEAASSFSMQKSSQHEVYLWVKGELLDIKGMTDAMTGRETVLKLKRAAESNLHAARTELEKYQAGKTTMKSFF